MNPDGVDDSHFLDWLEAADGTAVRDSAYLFYVLLLFAPGPLVTLLEGQFSFSRTPGLFGKAGAEYLNRRREDVSDFIPADVVENRTDFGIFERAPQRGINYAAYPATCSAMPAQRNLGQEDLPSRAEAFRRAH